MKSNSSEISPQEYQFLLRHDRRDLRKDVAEKSAK